jgi:hypothetical protein
VRRRSHAEHIRLAPYRRHDSKFGRLHFAPMEASAAVNTRLPDFYIVGAPKCGTTAMYEYLRQHPQIYMPFHKEPLFFGSDLTHRYGRMSAEDYRNLFTDARPDQRIGEASAWYLFSATAAAEIREATPEASIIVMLRNPVDVMYAQQSQLVFNRQENIEDFGEALAAESDRAAGHRLPPGPIRVENLLYRRMARFAEQIERYFEVFGRHRVHVILSDDLRADPSGTYRSTLEFLGVGDVTFAPYFAPVNENKRVRSAWLQTLIWRPPFARTIVPWLRRAPLVHNVRSVLLELNSQRVRRPLMDPGLRRRLVMEFEPEIARLASLIGRNLGHWVADVDA